MAVVTSGTSAGVTSGIDTDAVAPSGTETRRSRRSAWAMIVLGAVGLVASAALVIERLAVALDPDYVPPCSINPVLTCTSAMLSAQGEVFGVPNPLLGVAGFPVVVTTGFAVLAGARLASWYWTGMWLGGLGALGFMHWLVYVSLVEIDALCPYCLVVWAATIPLFAVVSGYAIPRGALGERVAQNTLVGDLLALRWWLVGLWFAVLAGLIGITFWDYWSTLL